MIYPLERVLRLLLLLMLLLLLLLLMLLLLLLLLLLMLLLLLLLLMLLLLLLLERGPKRLIDVIYAFCCSCFFCFLQVFTITGKLKNCKQLPVFYQCSQNSSQQLFTSFLKTAAGPQKSESRSHHKNTVNKW